MASVSKEDIEADLLELQVLQLSISRDRTKKLVSDEVLRCQRILQCLSEIDEESSHVKGRRIDPNDSHGLVMIRGKPLYLGSHGSATKCQDGSASTENKVECQTIANEIDSAKKCSSVETISSSQNLVQSALSFETLRNYAWHQTTKYVKLYVRVTGLKSTEKYKVICEFSSYTINLQVTDVYSKNYSLIINNLANMINPDKSRFETRKDEVVLNMQKTSPGWTWRAVTAVECDQLKKEERRMDREDRDSDCSYEERELQEVLDEENDIRDENDIDVHEENVIREGIRRHLKEQGMDGISSYSELVAPAAKTSLGPTTKPDNTNKSIIKRTNLKEDDTSNFEPSDQYVDIGNGFLDMECKLRRAAGSKSTSSGSRDGIAVTSPAAAFEGVDLLTRTDVELETLNVAIKENDGDHRAFVQLLNTISAYKHPLLLYLRCFDTFWHVNKQPCKKDAVRLRVLVRKKTKCILNEFWGQLSPSDMRLLPQDMLIVGLGIATREQFKMLHRLPNTRLLELCILRLMDVSLLGPLPERFPSASLHFHEITDQDQEWMMTVIHKVMTQRRTCIHLPNCKLTLSGCRVLARRLASCKVKIVTIHTPHIDVADRKPIEDMFNKANITAEWSLDPIQNWII